MFPAGDVVTIVASISSQSDHFRITASPLREVTTGADLGQIITITLCPIAIHAAFHLLLVASVTADVGVNSLLSEQYMADVMVSNLVLFFERIETSLRNIIPFAGVVSRDAPEFLVVDWNNSGAAIAIRSLAFRRSATGSRVVLLVRFRRTCRTHVELMRGDVVRVRDVRVWRKVYVFHEHDQLIF